MHPILPTAVKMSHALDDSMDETNILASWRNDLYEVLVLSL